MLKKHSEFFRSILFLMDVLLISACWILAYCLRFYTDFIRPAPSMVPFSTYLWFLGIVVVVWSFAFKAFDLYRPRRIGSHLKEILDVARACTFSLFILIAITYLLRRFELSRLSFFYFWILSILGLGLNRALFREALRFLRKKGYNLRYALIVGSGSTALDLVGRLEHHPELGIKIVGSLIEDPGKTGSKVSGIEVLGGFGDLKKIIRAHRIDILFIALPNDAQHHLESVLEGLSEEVLDVKIIPDLFRFATLRGGLDELDGLPIINLQGTPLYGWNRVLKRAFDVVFSIIGIVVFSPLLMVVAVLIKLTSPGPVFYVQERMGLDGRVFQMLKFRSMRMDAEKETGPVWAKLDDPRRTKVGAFLRKTNLDELPQLFNVLDGDMSMVGPRPERSAFVRDFRGRIPKYMLRHKMKAGITGWAQINGLRGDTSIEDRIRYDLSYINNWSIWFDLKILIMTLWSGFKNAY